MKNAFYLFVFGSIISTWSCNQEIGKGVLNFVDFTHYIDEFNEGDNELYAQHVPNKESSEFLEYNVPLLDIPDKELERIYYFRWWTYRKHIKSTPDGFVITEFLPDVPWAGKYNTINCPAAHQIYEGRWLRDSRYMEDYIGFWLNEAGDDVRRYSFWVADALLAYSKVNRQDEFIASLLPKLEENFTRWEKDRKDGPDQLFWQIDDRDGMEYSASGRILNEGKSVGSTASIRPTINSYMYGDAVAIETLASLFDLPNITSKFTVKAQKIQALVQDRLWNDSLNFFAVMKRDYDSDTKPLNIREIIGYIPWYFNLPDDTPKYTEAWSKLMDTTGFFAPYGLAVCEQSHPFFQISYEGHECQWNGPSWPFATTQTLKSLSNFLNNYTTNEMVNRDDYYTLLKQYADSHSIAMEDGEEHPWIDENLNPYTGDWISRTRLKSWNNGNWSEEKGGVERGKDYNHSGFCDLVISDLIGFKPQLDKSVRIEPMVPNSWDWFCLDQIKYHGEEVTILWDKNGKRYNRGKGFKVYRNGKVIFSADQVMPISVPVQ